MISRLSELYPLANKMINIKSKPLKEMGKDDIDLIFQVKRAKDREATKKDKRIFI
jgi:hypothetical protein